MSFDAKSAAVCGSCIPIPHLLIACSRLRPMIFISPTSLKSVVIVVVQFFRPYRGYFHRP